MRLPTWLEVQIQMPSGACTLPYYALVVERGSFSSFIPLKLKYASLKLTAFTPTQVQPGAVFVLEGTGFNLDGAQLIPGPHVRLASDVQVSSDSLGALIEVAADAVPGQSTSVTVTGPRGRQTVALDILSLTASKEAEEVVEIPAQDFAPPRTHDS